MGKKSLIELVRIIKPFVLVDLAAILKKMMETVSTLLLAPRIPSCISEAILPRRFSFTLTVFVYMGD